MLGETRLRERAFEAAIGVRDNAEREPASLEFAQNRRGRRVGSAPEHFRLGELQRTFDRRAEFIRRESDLWQKCRVKLPFELIGGADAFRGESRHGIHGQRLRAREALKGQFTTKLVVEQLAEAGEVQMDERAARIEEDGFHGVQRSEDPPTPRLRRGRPEADSKLAIDFGAVLNPINANNLFGVIDPVENSPVADAHFA